jgi:hypothetical protein
MKIEQTLVCSMSMRSRRLTHRFVGYRPAKLCNDLTEIVSRHAVNKINEPLRWKREGVVTKSIGSLGAAEAADGTAAIESVADILERDLQPLIADWLSRVEQEPELTCIPLNFEQRTGHLPRLLHDVTARLRLDAGTKAPISEAASFHGDLRRKQGYLVEMLIEESRLLQVCIFTTLHKNVKNLEFSTLLPYIVTIADEVDAQLKQQMKRFKAADAAK